MDTFLFILLGFLSYFVFLPIFEVIIRFFLGPTKGKTIYSYDEYRRITLYHGVNICNYSKISPTFLPWHEKKNYEKLKDHGFNLVRFLIFWEAIEPEKGKYDYDYLRSVKDHLHIMKELDIKVILDLHQNLYSSKYKKNGFPSWVISNKEKDKKEENKDISRTYKRLYKNGALLQSYKNLLVIIQDFYAEEKNIIGIDVMNEPYPAIPFPLFFERNYLSKFYASIGCEQNKIPFYYEPPIWCSAGLPSNIGEELHIANKNYIPHYFPPLVKYKRSYKKIDKFLLKCALRSKAREAQKMNSHAILGEIGISTRIKNNFNFIKDFIDIADKQYLSWIWWCYDKDTYSRHGLLDSYGNPNNTMESLSRPYPQKIAGTDPYYYNEGELFYIEYTSNKTFKVPTEIYIPGRIFDIETNTVNLPYTEVPNKKGLILKFYTKVFGRQKIKIKWMSS